jgi:hypothetical protein
VSSSSIRKTMDPTASSFTARNNAKRAAEKMVANGTAPAVDYGIRPRDDDGRLEIVWKPAPTRSCRCQSPRRSSRRSPAKHHVRRSRALESCSVGQLGAATGRRQIEGTFGHARLSSDVSEIKIAFGIPPERPSPNFPPSWNVAPTDSLPVVRYDLKAGQRSLDMLRWGLIPYWAKDIKVGFANINEGRGDREHLVVSGQSGKQPTPLHFPCDFPGANLHPSVARSAMCAGKRRTGRSYEPRRSSSPESAGGELFDIIGYVADKFASGRPPGG